jgi:hypothetical protein
MAVYRGPSTTNEAEMLATGIAGRKVPDRYATDEQMKFSDVHTKRIHNDLSRYLDESPESDCM